MTVCANRRTSKFQRRVERFWFFFFFRPIIFHPPTDYQQMVRPAPCSANYIYGLYCVSLCTRQQSEHAGENNARTKIAIFRCRAGRTRQEKHVAVAARRRRRCEYRLAVKLCPGGHPSKSQSGKLRSSNSCYVSYIQVYSHRHHGLLSDTYSLCVRI